MNTLTVAEYKRIWNSNSYMRIDKEAVISLIHKAETFQEVDRIAEVTHTVAELALRESSELLICTTEYCGAQNVRLQLGERALEAL